MTGLYSSNKTVKKSYLLTAADSLTNQQRSILENFEGCNDLYLTSSLDIQVQPAFFEVQNFLKTFASSADFDAKMQEAFGDSIDIEKVEVLRDFWGKGELGSFPEIEIRNSAEINGAKGAFAKATNKIYLSQELLSAGNVDEVAAVVLEEFGHYVDSQINVTETPGDEGEIFAALVQGNVLSEGQFLGLKAEDDRAIVRLDEETIEIEQANISLNQTFNESLSNTDAQNPIQAGKFADDYAVNGVPDWQQVQVNLNSSDFDAYLELINASTGEVIASNDDAFGSKNSQLSFTKFPGVNYLLRASSYRAGETEFIT